LGGIVDLAAVEIIACFDRTRLLPSKGPCWAGGVSVDVLVGC